MVAVRRLVTISILLGLAVATTLVLSGDIRILPRVADRGEVFSVSLYILSTSVQALSAVLGVTIAVLFIAAQFGPTVLLQRGLVAILRERTSLAIISFFLFTILFALATLGALISVIEAGALWIVDLNIVFAGATLLFLGPLVLVQVENLNPHYLGAKLARQITTRAILRYGLARVEVHHGEATPPVLELVTWSRHHGREDPLGPFHEVVMMAVRARDRVLLDSLMRLLLNRIARAAGTPYPLLADHGLYRVGGLARALRRLEAEETSRCIAISLHLLHYFVRRAAHLIQEWGEINGVRQQFLWNLHDLVASLCKRSGNAAVLELGLFAAFHIDLSYAQVPATAEDEVLVGFATLATELEKRGYAELGYLGASLLASLSVSTRHTPREVLASLQEALSPELRERFRRAVAAHSQASLVYSRDPWKGRLAGYTLSRPDSNIPRTRPTAPIHARNRRSKWLPLGMLLGLGILRSLNDLKSPADSSARDTRK